MRLYLAILLTMTGSAAAAPRYKVRIENNVMIPMRDGVRLAADLIRPDAEGRFPVLIEYIPYRKDDSSRSGYNAHHYLAERGFIGVRLDVRGTGSSQGVNTDEYMPVEQQDGYDAVEWLARQPWSNGNIGMYGTSYGGFTCVQVAMHRPPHLKAIAPMYATDDRYTDDCHYTQGGSMRMYYDAGTYGGFMVGMNALPAMKETLGDRWEQAWLDRLKNNEPYIPKWMGQQVDGPYWRGASLRPDYARIQIPVFLIAGWRDGYPNAMLRMFESLKAPKRLLMGPWVHSRPNASIPGPRMDHFHEMARFFGHYLRGEDTGWEKDPPMLTYMQEHTTPSRTLDITPGAWRADTAFPVRGTRERVFHLSEGGRLAERAGPEAFDEYDYKPATGLANGFWSGGGITFYLPDDQRADEAYSSVFTSAPMDQDLRILGWPQVKLHGSSTARVSTFVAKLADVAPDGHSALIVDGSLNGARRESLTDPKPMEPGAVYELNIPMLPTGWLLKKGHRLRLAISSSDFPNIWPTPERARLRVYHGGRYASRVLLPVAPESRLEVPSFLPPPQLAAVVGGSSEDPKKEVNYDQITGLVTMTNRTAGTVVMEDGGTLFRGSRFRCWTSSTDPSSSGIVGTHEFSLKREGETIEITAESAIQASETTFKITTTLTVRKNGKPFYHNRSFSTEPRRLL